LTSKTVSTRTGGEKPRPPSSERTTRIWFSAGVLKFSKET
jgi:hypothetical protein